MSGKFMRTRRIVIPTLTLLLIASQLSGCGATDKAGALQLLRDNGESIEIEVAEPVNSTGDLDLQDDNCTWLPLASLDTASSLRKSWEDTLLISGTTGNKNGVLYVDFEGNQDNNNTLQVALHNRAFTTQLEDKATSTELSQAVKEYYADTDELTDNEKNLIGISSYFNLLDDEQSNYATPYDTLTRLQFYSMVYKSITPATDIPESDSDELQFTESVGSYSELNYYASQIESKAYINTTDNSLNEKTVNGKISRGEAIYLLMNVIYPDELANVETKGVTFSDCKMQEDALTKQDGTDGDTYLDSYRAQVSYNNEDEYGCKDEIYKALVLAKQKGLINGDETRYDEAITKVEAIQFLVDTLENSGSGEKFNYKNGKTIASETTENNVTTENNFASDEFQQTKEYDSTTDTNTSTETSNDTSAKTQNSSSTDTVVKNGITFATDVTSDNMQLIIDACDANVIEKSDFDINGDGVIDEQEIEDGFEDFSAEDIQHAIDRRNQNKAALENYQSEASSTTTPSTSSSNSTLEEREDKTDPNNFIDWDAPMDHSKADKNITIY
jgi:hypothetical protein